MSESGYRDARDAARARVSVLETQLAELRASATKLSDQKGLRARRAAVRSQLVRRGRTRKGFTLAAISVIGFFLRTGVYSGEGPSMLETILMLMALGVALVSWRPTLAEKKLENELRALVREEDDTETRLRVEPEPVRKRIEAERSEMEKIEAELEEARALAEERDARS